MSLGPETAEKFHDQPLPAEGVKLAHLRSTKISQDIRAAVETETAKQSKRFRGNGGRATRRRGRW